MRCESLVTVRAMVCALVLPLACGGEAGADTARRSGDTPSPFGVGGPDAGVPESGVAPVAPVEPVPMVPEPFEDPGCPPVSSLPDINRCDPLASPTGCADGESCFPFVRYPAGPCEVERYGTVCRRAGAGVQGESCAVEDCAADHICVSTGRGTQCVRLCGFGPGAPSVCEPGLLCLPVDIEGFGGCL